MAATAAGVLAAQPCAAAAGPGHFGEGRIASFAGVNVRMPLGQAGRNRPSARLQLTSSHHMRDARTGSVRTFKAKGLELGADRNGAPALYLNGQTTAEIKERAGLASSTPDTVWMVFGVALVAVGVLVISNLDGLSD
jgi:hypothetical protein